VALIATRARLGHVVLVAHARAVAARRRAGVAVGVRARHAVVLERVVLHAHPEGGIGRADLAARAPADVAVRVRARLAGPRRAHAGARVRVGGVVGAHPVGTLVVGARYRALRDRGRALVPRLQAVVARRVPVGEGGGLHEAGDLLDDQGGVVALRTRGRLRVHHDEIELEVTEIVHSAGD